MTNTAAADAFTATRGAWSLTGITPGAGQCDCCSRRITQRVFEVSHPRHGLAQLGRRCAAKATGYAASAIERELARVARCAEIARRRAIIAAAYPIFTQVYADMLAWQGMSDEERNAAPDRHPGADYMRLYERFTTAATVDCWWGGRGYAAYATWQEYVEAR